ncbi:hypothetical protein FNF27_06551 [Cafeteria roenbergensis]|nr:hypothetical protein FNF27_06551 [Cafeteria roenbergensis]
MHDDDDIDMGDEGIAAMDVHAAAAPSLVAAAAASAPPGASAGSSSSASSSSAPSFTPLSSTAGVRTTDAETRQIRVPSNRFTPLREQWESIMRPLVEHMRLQVRFNPKTRCVEMRNGKSTEDSGALTKAEEFVSAFMCGFEVRDAIALLRLEDLRVESFDVTDVKTLRGDHLSRAIGRIAGMGGKTKFAIENATRTRIVVADAKVHILGAYANIQVARDAVCSLILGSPPGKIYNQMRNVAARIGQRY